MSDNCSDTLRSTSTGTSCRLTSAIDPTESADNLSNSWGPSTGRSVGWEPVGGQLNMVHLFITLVVLGTIILATIIGNVFVIAAVVLERNLRNVANYLIASLAVADLLVAALVMPLAAVNEVSSRWFLGKELCDAFVSFDVLCCTASILHLVAISLDRYWAVTQVDYIHNRSGKRIIGMIIASWGLSVVISFPPLFFQSDPNYDPNASGECLISQDLGYTVFSTVGAFYLPFALMMIIYLKVFRAARARIHKKRFNKQQKQQQKQQQQQREQRRQQELRDDETSRNEPDELFGPTTVGLDGGVVGFSVDDGGSTASHSPPDHPSMLATTVTLTVFTCDDDENFTREPSLLDSPPVVRPNRLALGDLADRNGGRLSSPTSPSSLFKPSSSHLLSTPRRASPALVYRTSTTRTRGSRESSCPGSARASPAASLRGSWLDLTKQFILDRRKDLSPKSKEQRAKERLEQKRERKAARTLAVITGSFIGCWLPFFILALVRPFCGDSCSYPAPLLSVIGWLGYFNSLLNPVIYTVFNPDFRSAFRKILFGKYRRQRPRFHDQQCATITTNLSLVS